MWLRKELGGEPVQLKHKRERCFGRLRSSFGYHDAKEKSDGLDPGFVAAQHVVWPKYPVYVCPPDDESWVIDDRFHVDRLAPINREKFVRKAAEWEYLPSCIGDVRWDVLDWTDNRGEGATGSRIRFWLPANIGAKKPLQFWELATLLEPQVWNTVPLVTVQSMSVEHIRAIYRELPCMPGTGCRAWLDFRGAATPRLTADRRTALIPTGESDWRNVVVGVWARYVNHLAEQERERLPQILWNIWLTKIAMPLKTALLDKPRSARLATASDLPIRQPWGLASAALVLEVARARARAQASYESNRDFDFDSAYYNRCRRLRDDSLERTLDRASTNARAKARARARVLGRSLATDIDFAQDLAIDMARGLARDRPHGLYRDLDAARSTRGAKGPHLSMLQANWLQEAFSPSLSESWPGAGLQGLQGRIGDAILTAPASFRFDLQGELALFADPEGQEPPELSEYRYDICLPMTAIPLGELRRVCSAWREDRRYRPIGVLPFLMPQLAKVWQACAEELLLLFPVGRIYAFWPTERLWYTPFAEWTRADWQDDKNHSLLWNIGDGTVLLAQGVQPLETTRTAGRPFTDFSDL